MDDTPSKKFLLTSARSPLTLDIARQLKAAGHEIFISDTTWCHVSRFSNTITKNFTVPSPRFGQEAFINAMLKIVKDHKIDFILPIYEEILYLSKEAHRFPKQCQIFSPPFDLLHRLHNKWTFNNTLKSLGFPTAETILLETEEDLIKIDRTKTYAVKACYSRASLSLKKVRPHESLPRLPISPSNPWVAQEWLEGKKYCSYTICHNGNIHAHALYPVGYAIDGNSCLVFEAIEHPVALAWITKLVKQLNFTGQIAFDFIETADGTLHAIECNPRATSGAYLFRAKDRLDQAFLKRNTKPIFAKEGSSKQIAIGMSLYGWRRSAIPSNSMRKFLGKLFGVRDVIFAREDVKPFISIPFVFLGQWLDCKRKRITLPAAFTYDVEWNGEDEEKG